MPWAWMRRRTSRSLQSQTPLGHSAAAAAGSPRRAASWALRRSRSAAMAGARYIQASLLKPGTRLSQARIPPLILASFSVGSDVQVRHFQGVLLDELPARLHLVAHERGEHVVGAAGVVDLHLEQAA